MVKLSHILYIFATIWDLARKNAFDGHYSGEIRGLSFNNPISMETAMHIVRIEQKKLKKIFSDDKVQALEHVLMDMVAMQLQSNNAEQRMLYEVADLQGEGGLVYAIVANHTE